MNPSTIPQERIGRALIRAHKENYFELDFGRVAGKRFRLYRSSREEAEKTAKQKTAELKDLGRLATTLGPSERLEAADCFKRLAPLNARLSDVVTDFIKRHPMGGMGRTLEQVVKELIGKKREGNRRKRYVDDLEWKLRKFCEVYPNRPITSFSAEDIEAYLDRHPHWKPRTVSSIVQALKVFFYYGIKRGYSTENPCLRLELAKPDDKEVQILPVSEIKRLLDLAAPRGEEFFYDCTTYLAIGFFSGIRPEEMEKLQWEQVDFENKTIAILSSSAKGRARRIVDMSPNLMAWIRPYYDMDHGAGSVLPISVRVLRDQMRRAAKLDRWPQNVMRHCFASYHFAKHRNEPLLMQLMGHGDDGRILHNHYRALVQPNAAEAFWNIFPSNP